MGRLNLERPAGTALVLIDRRTGHEIGTVRVGAVGASRVQLLCDFPPDVKILRDELVAGRDPATGRVLQYAPAAYPGDDDGPEGGWQ